MTFAVVRNQLPYDNLHDSVQFLLDLGYKEASEVLKYIKIRKGQPEYSLRQWDKTKFKLPADIEKSEVMGASQSVRLKIVYHEDGGLGFSSVIVLSLILFRSLPADGSSVPPPDVDIQGSNWVVSKIRYLDSPLKRGLLCLEW